jgi:hypothetical protein
MSESKHEEIVRRDKARAEAGEAKAAKAQRQDQPEGLCVYFYDGDTGQLLNPGAPKLELRVGKKTATAVLTEVKGRYHIAPDAWSALLKELGVGTGQAVEAQMKAETYEINCTRYVSTPLSLLVSEEEGPCCCVPIPLSQLEEACTITVHAYDCSFVDFIENAEAFLDEVEVVVTALPTPAATHAPKSTQRAKTFTAKTEGGIARIAEVPLHYLYRVEIRAPQGYICETPALLHRYICCERSVEIHTHLRPCGKNPTRSVVFVRQECAGVRWANAHVEVAGNILPTDENGVLHLPNDISGIVEIKYPGKAFSPASLNLSEGGAMVHTVAVADHDALSKMVGMAKRRFRFVDEYEHPFRGRPVIYVTESGEKKVVHTDDNGYFEAEEGSWAYAEQHELSPGTEPFLLSSISE